MIGQTPWQFAYIRLRTTILSLSRASKNRTGLPSWVVRTTSGKKRRRIISRPETGGAKGPAAGGPAGTSQPPAGSTRAKGSRAETASNPLLVTLDMAGSPFDSRNRPHGRLLVSPDVAMSNRTIIA